VKLTAKQQAFIKEYLIDLNSTQAAIRAGYSKATAKEMGYENLTKPHIKKAVDEAINKRSEKLGITAEYVLYGLKDISDSVEEKTTDRLKAFELLGKHLKLFTEKVEQSGETTHNINGASDISKLSVEELKQIESILSKAD
jgi:phage terminase small subunit